MTTPQHPVPYPQHLTPSASPKPKLLMVDGGEPHAEISWALAQDYQLLVAGNRKAALEIVRKERPGVVILDLGLPPHRHGAKEGFQILHDILRQETATKVIVFADGEEREHALRAISEGACDFFWKPIQTDELQVTLRRAFHIYQLEQEYRELRQSCLKNGSFEGMVGTSPQMQDVFAAICKVATTDVPVLIAGESGTGKELVARAIHRQSARGNSPFVPINCSAIPESLLESELFGHEKGAFTGAHIRRRGRIESAHGGTVFLDEIGEFSLSLQVKLLRFLQEHNVERIGGREEIAVDARVLAATNGDLRQAMKVGRFREDLYHRISVVVITLPPLRDREGDVLRLAQVFLERYAAKSYKKAVGFTAGAIRAMESYGWPGNVRELENRIKRAVIMAEKPRLTAEDLELAWPYARYQGQGLREARADLERELVQRAISRAQGNLTRAAADLRLSRPTLYELMQKLGIRREKA